MSATFEYASPSEIVHETEDFVLMVPSGLQTEEELLAAFSSAGEFPGYFGHNWDALLDCLRDLSWIGNRKVVIAHSDVPLQNSPSKSRIYLEILQTAQADWSKVPRANVIPAPPEWPYVEHDLRVVFPTEARTVIARLVGTQLR